MMQWGGSGMTEEEFDWIREHYPDGSVLVEFGCGEISTPRLQHHYKLTSYEDNVNWYSKIKFITPLVRLYHAPLDTNKFYDREVVKNSIPTKIDLILLDGPLYNENSSREGFIDMYESGIIDTSADIIVDDVWRECDMNIATRLVDTTGKTLTIADCGQYAVLR